MIMGTMAEARCDECGYTKKDLNLYGGMANFMTYSGMPALDEK